MTPERKRAILASSLEARAAYMLGQLSELRRQVEARGARPEDVNRRDLLRGTLTRLLEPFREEREATDRLLLEDW